MGTFTESNTATFTVTHARYLASKVSADLKRIQRFYGKPSDEQIVRYELELIDFLKAGYLDSVYYGFKRDGAWIEPTLIYTAKSLGTSSSTDDDPGKVRPGSDVSGASFYSFMVTNSKWDNESSSVKEAFEKNLPFVRGEAVRPGINGYLQNDRSYSSGGQTLDRSSVRKY